MRIPDHPEVERISFRGIVADLLGVLNLERGITYTIRKLLADPQGAIREYLFEDRRRMARPLPLLVLLVAVAAYLSFRFLPIQGDVLEKIQNAPSTASLPPLILRTLGLYLAAIQQYFNLTFVSTLPFQALATWLLYRNLRLHYMEHLVINVYIVCIQTLVYIVFIPLFSRFPMLVVIPIASLSVGYLLYALRRIFGMSWVDTIARAVGVWVFLQAAQVFIFGCFLVAALLQ
jgi:hypothetical protein